jgi:hypothetical protein
VLTRSLEEAGVANFQSCCNITGRRRAEPWAKVVGQAAPGSFEGCVGSRKSSAAFSGAARERAGAEHDAASVGELTDSVTTGHWCGGEGDRC